MGAVLSVGDLGPVTPEQLLSENAQLRAQLATGARRLVSAALLTECIHYYSWALPIRNTSRAHSLVESQALPSLMARALADWLTD